MTLDSYFLSSSSFFRHANLSALSFQRQVLRPGMVFSVLSRNWWRKSSRALASGRVRTMAEAFSSQMKMQVVEHAVVIVPWFKAHICANTASVTNIYPVLWHKGSGALTAFHLLSCKAPHCLFTQTLLFAQLSHPFNEIQVIFSPLFGCFSGPCSKF